MARIFRSKVRPFIIEIWTSRAIRFCLATKCSRPSKVDALRFHARLMEFRSRSSVGSLQ